MYEAFEFLFERKRKKKRKETFIALKQLKVDNVRSICELAKLNLRST